MCVAQSSTVRNVTDRESQVHIARLDQAFAAIHIEMQALLQGGGAVLRLEAMDHLIEARDLARDAAAAALGAVLALFHGLASLLDVSPWYGEMVTGR